MNSSQKLVLFILILVSLTYVYFSFFENDFNLKDYRSDSDSNAIYNPLTTNTAKETDLQNKNNTGNKIVKIFILDKSGKLRSVNRTCNLSAKNSCFAYAIEELIAGPTKWEKSKGFTSEIPQTTKLISVRESSDSILIDLSSDFETGGGAESTYMRIQQIIKTANTNSSVPTYLYLNGKQANVIGGEGIMLKQPLNNKSLNE